MKKILLFLVFIMMLNIPVFASNCAFINCTEPYDLSFGISRFMSNVTGSNFLGVQVAQMILKKEINKTVEGKISVNIDSYSVKDLKKGIFKSIHIKGKDISTEGVYFSRLDIKTLCDFNYISLEDPKNPVFKEDLPLSFNAVFTEDDINKTMQGSGYKKVIDDLNMLGSSLGVFRVDSSQIRLKDNKFYYILKITIPFVKNPQNVILMSDLQVSKGQIDLTNSKLVNKNFLLDLKQIDRVINYLNPLDFSLKILENKHAQLAVKMIKIQDSKIYINGVIFIPKD